MEIYDERLIVMRRQIDGLQSAVKFFQDKYNEDAKTIVSLQHSITELTTQLQSIAQHVALLRATTMGHGSTVRS